MRIDDHGAWPETEEELLEVMQEHLNKEHDYNTSAEALVECTVAAFNYCTHVLGITGFQASWAELSFIRRTRGLKGPFAILNGENLLYPQYDLREDFERYMEEWPRQLKARAQELLEKDDGFMSPRVKARVEEIAALDA